MSIKQGRTNNMEKIQLTHWRGKLVCEMSKEELIEALNDAHHLWREAIKDGVQGMVNITEKVIEIKSQIVTANIALIGMLLGALLLGFVMALSIDHYFPQWLSWV